MNNEVNSLYNDNLNDILYNKQKKKVDNKIERLDFLSSSFQNSFQSNSNNIDKNKISIHNNKIFNNVFNLESKNKNEIQNKMIQGNNNVNNYANKIATESLALKKEIKTEKASDSDYFNKKNLNLCLISPNHEITNNNLERELLKKNLGVYETKNIDQSNKTRFQNMNVKIEDSLNTDNYRLNEELKKDFKTLSKDLY
jgi:hypothetical protein